MQERVHELRGLGHDGSLNKIWDAMYKFSSGYISSHYDREDVVQESFLSLIKSIGSFHGEMTTTRLKTLMRSITKNKLIDLLRRKKLVGIDSNDLEKLLVYSPESEVDEPDRMYNEKKKWVAESIIGLPKNLSDALTMYYFRGLTYKEIARSLDIPVTTVKSGIFRARSQIRKYYSAHTAA